jgi:excisionase family DNA binding protein
VRRWHSVAEVAQMLGLAPMTVYRAIHDGRLPATKIGRRYLIPASALDAMEKAATRSGRDVKDDSAALSDHADEENRPVT